jgi:hypothetical protein
MARQSAIDNRQSTIANQAPAAAILPLQTAFADLEGFEHGFGFMEAFLVLTGGDGVRNDSSPSL